MKILSPLLLSSLLLAGQAFADEVAENLDSAKSAYEAGNYSEAIQSLDYASTLIRQKKSEVVAKLLPDAPSGWTAEEVQNETAAGAMMGGMLNVQRRYQRADGEGSVRLQIQSDSAILQSYGMMFANPAIMAASGAKLETIKGQRCAITYKASDKDGDVKAVVDNRYFVVIEGNGVSREELVSFVKAIDFAKLSAQK